MIAIMRQLMRWAPELRGKFARAAVFKVLQAMFMAAPYGFVYLILNDLLIGVLTAERVCLYTAGLAFCYLVQGVFDYLFCATAWVAANALVKKLRIMVGEHLRKLSMGYFSETTTGSIHTLVSDETLYIQMFLLRTFPDTVVAFSLATLATLVLLFIDWRMALATAVAIPAAGPFFLWFKRTWSRAAQKRSDSMAEMNTELIEYVQGMEVLKGFNQTGTLFSKLREKLKKFRDINLILVWQGEPLIGLILITLELGLCLILLVSMYLLLGGQISLPVVLIFLIAGLRIYEPVKLLIPATNILKMTEPTIRKIKRLLDTPPLPQPAAGQSPQGNDIEFRDVTFGYGDAPVLNNVSFASPEKTITALVGPSGSGKTTVTRLIARFWDVDSGQVLVGGQNVKGMDMDGLLSRISMVFQDVYLFNDTIYQNIAYGSPNAAREQIVQAAKTAQCHDFITALPDGYDTLVGEGGATLSGGERQRISIARAILKDAPIILLDEATASVDPENEYLIQKALNALVESKTLIIIAHRLSTITTADRIVALNAQGKVEEMGTHNELLQNGGLYARLWKSRVQARQWDIGGQRNPN